MSQKDPSQAADLDLRKVIQAMIEDSPTLDQYPEQKEAFLGFLPQLSEDELKVLKGHLDAESDDWKALFEKHTDEQEELIEKLEKESMDILKSAEKEIKETENAFSEADKSQADELLNQFDQ